MKTEPIRHRRDLFAWVSALLCLVAGNCLADTLTMDNGDRLTGRITRIAKGKIELSTDYAGALSIDAAKVRKLESDQPITLEIDKTRYYYGTLSGTDGHLWLHPDGGAAPIAAPINDGGVILPGRVTGREWKYSGHINVGGSDSRGNSVTSHTHLDTEVVAQREIFRVVAGATVNRATDHDQETESNALANVKYDRFITLKQFGYGNLTLEHDKFKDIRLRNTIGAGRGYDALTTPRTNLAIEGGPSYVFTDFYSSSDEHYPALHLALRFDHYLIPNRLQLFQQTEVFVGLDSLRKSFAHTKTGLRMPLRDNLVANVEYDVDWDGDPAPGRVSTDRNLLFSLGYQW
jgi:putative salt-induced outer membrane protein YdiY